MVAHPASCGHGLNLQDGGHVCVWFGITPSLELYLQANKRLDRPGQKSQVLIYRIISRDTVDERICYEILAGKKTMHEVLMAEIKRN